MSKDIIKIPAVDYNKYSDLQSILDSILHVRNNYRFKLQGQDNHLDSIIEKYDSDCKEAIKQINVRLNTWKKLIGKYYKMTCVNERHNHEYKDIFYIFPYEVIDTNKTLWMLVVKCNDEYNGGVKDTVFHVDEYWNYDTYLEEISEEEFRERACESTKFVIDRRLHRLHEPKSEYRIISGEHELDN